MKKIAFLVSLFTAIAFAGEANVKARDSVITQPTHEQLSEAKALNNTICPVTKAKIGSLGPAILVVYRGQVVSLCCPSCVANFAKSPDEYMILVNDELKKKNASSTSNHSGRGSGNTIERGGHIGHH